MGFKCIHCGKEVNTEGDIGTRNRNHCPFCLYSLHLDRNIPGDRKEDCKGEMVPIGIAFKNVKKDKYGKEKFGEIMLVHRCTKCGDISKNRIANDDNTDEILRIAEESVNEEELKEVYRQIHGD